MNQYHSYIVDFLRGNSPTKTITWQELIALLEKSGCRVAETTGFHLSVERRGRVARFHFGSVGRPWRYQLETLREFLEETA